MASQQYEETEKGKSQYREESEAEQNTNTENEQANLGPRASDTRSLSSQFPPPTLKPFIPPPVSSSSNTDYFTSPVSETPSSFSQSTSFSESPETPQEGQNPRRRSYTKTLSLPLPNQAMPIPHPSPSTTSFPTPTSHPAAESSMYEYGQPIEPGPMYLTGEKIVQVEVQGEIIVAEGWRRHTRVFGGGVCKACEESKQEVERRGTA
ncbi:hypothetical protein HYALB_00010218 [Hymenoscyphus albidus]|uniref:Uncharacterized protein n=1 Tax=Hymenoscyphus albidus TaxID=595503 RepID=A0A9N9LTC3_9HELO|nr:hypothetical protein HYALB_00010218 [Hymenoscyphus albidus]